MFDFSFSEIALFVIVAMVFIRPKDLPVAIRTISNGLKAMRRMAGEFQSHIDEMVRDADLTETRDQLRDLKNFNFRDHVTKTIDKDNSIRKSLDFQPSGLDALPKVPSPPPPPIEASSNPSKPYNALQREQENQQDDLEGVPVILPPTTARRLKHEQERWKGPTIVPPIRVIHHGKRVAISSMEKGS
ncbi:Sec-independent protein translocase protein TatB [Swingsia samuiensis]|uniref:Twin-arginine translocase subunit TatB n=1 Tax=Swingsia samuiensis TaxID=1293412 RepID=A0A4Y6UN52_9PROT|nr:Sec-independent protein translocase protein TatB [Swingsia samuiensis]QDH17475.1 twin-arginine translocase subunit TatB [Swingsia samuiensis]